jgi:hypothetical protein
MEFSAQKLKRHFSGSDPRGARGRQIRTRRLFIALYVGDGEHIPPATVRVLVEKGVRRRLERRHPIIGGFSLPHVVEAAMLDQSGPQLFFDLDVGLRNRSRDVKSTRTRPRNHIWAHFRMTPEFTGHNFGLEALYGCAIPCRDRLSKRVCHGRAPT